MSNLIISKISDSIVSIDIPDNIKSIDWLHDVGDLIEQTFEKDDTLILLIKYGNKLKDITDYYKEINQLTQIWTGESWYTINAINYETAKLAIKQIVLSLEFELGVLFMGRWHGKIDKLSDELINDCIEIERKGSFLEMPLLKHEFWAFTGDGTIVFWFNPSIDVKKYSI